MAYENNNNGYSLPASNVTAAPSIAGRRIYPGIDLLRALAALLVLMYHVVEVANWTKIPNEGAGYLARHGWIGVDLFFTISGFVIALSALSGVQAQGRQFRRAFFKHRLARIVPLYVLTSCVFVFLVNPSMLLSTKSVLVHAVSHLLFVHNLAFETHGSINGPSWSVGLEMQFYLLMMIVAPWLARTTILRLLIYTLLMGALWRAAGTWLMPAGDSTPIRQFIFTTQLPGVVDEFGLGIALAMVVHRNGEKFAPLLFVRWRNCLGWFAVAIAFLGVAAYIDRSTGDWRSSLVIWWRPILSAGCAALLAAAITFPAAGSALLAPARYLGKISYGIYLWHMMVLLSAMEVAAGRGGPAILRYTLLGSIGLAALTWHLLEKPSLEKYR